MYFYVDSQETIPVQIIVELGFVSYEFWSCVSVKITLKVQPRFLTSVESVTLTYLNWFRPLLVWYSLMIVSTLRKSINVLRYGQFRILFACCRVSFIQCCLWRTKVQFVCIMMLFSFKQICCTLENTLGPELWSKLGKRNYGLKCSKLEEYTGGSLGRSEELASGCFVCDFSMTTGCGWIL